jgi:predicted nucleic acid-binding protein
VLRLVAARKLVPLATTALFLEYEAVLKRSEQRLTHGLQLDEIDQFLAALASACEVVDVRFQWRPQLNDTNDEMVLEAAVNGRADEPMAGNPQCARLSQRRETIWTTRFIATGIAEELGR